MASFPLPPPPAAGQPQPQQQSTAYSSQMEQVGQQSQALDSRQMAAQGIQVLGTEVQNMITSAKRIATVGEKMLPALAGDLSKLTEILVSMKKQVEEAAQAQQGSSGAQPQPSAPPPPTDAQVAA